MIIDDKLAELKAKYDATEDDSQENSVVEHKAEDEQNVAEAQSEEESSPPGLIKTYEEWIAAGKDPDKFKGKKAYEAEFKRIQEVKALKADVNTMKETLRLTTSAIADREQKAVEKALAEAKERGDIDGALEASEQLSELKTKIQRTDSAPQQHPVISEFISNNVILESPAMLREFEQIYNGLLVAKGVRANDEVSEARINSYLKAAMEEVKTIYPEKFASVKSNRQAPVRTTAAPMNSKIDYAQKLKDFKIIGVSKQNENAAFEVYKMLETTNPKAAENYAKQILGV